ncbi:MAG: plasmid partitioning protein RepB [Pseudomonadota bacterium]
MARKDLLKGLMNPAPAPRATETKSAKKPSEASEAGEAPAPQRRARGAIGAVSQSIEALKARSLIEIDPFLIDAGGLQDRLESDDAEDQSLLYSIREYGQQVPVLVRPHPEVEGRYQIVYGRRRVLAMRDLGQPVKALVRDLDDGELVMAQGQENTARRGLSYIEKASFAAQMREAGYKRRAICDAISVDKTQISRMLATVDRVGLTVVQAIGAAPAIGRDRWSEFATLAEKLHLDEDDLRGMANLTAPDRDSSAKFNNLLKTLDKLASRAAEAAPEQEPRRKKEKEPAARPIHAPTSAFPIATVEDKKSEILVSFSRDTAFGTWLVENLSELHRDWVEKAQGDEE